MLLDECFYSCPYCGEPISLVLDLSGDDQSYYEDCSVCCRPIKLTIYSDGQGQLDRLLLQRDDE